MMRKLLTMLIVLSAVIAALYFSGFVFFDDEYEMIEVENASRSGALSRESGILSKDESWRNSESEKVLGQTSNLGISAESSPEVEHIETNAPGNADTLDKLGGIKLKQEKTDQKRSEAAKKLAEKVKESGLSEEDLRIVNDTVQRLHKAMKEGRWSDFMTIYDSLSQEDTNLLDLAVFQGLQYDAPLSVIKQLVQRGGSIPKESVLTLVAKQNISLLNEMVNLGIEITAQDPTGANALTYAAMSNSSLEMFNFLIANGVDVQSNGDYLDSLNYLLQDYRITNDVIAKISLLMGNGQLVYDSHKEQLINIKTENASFYEQLLNVVPELDF